MPQRPVPDSSVEESTDKGSTVDSLGSGETLQRGDRPERPAGHLPPLLEGRYEVDDRDDRALLGRGGQGTVWRAYDNVLQREVALKKMHGAAASDPAVVAAFLREARLTARLEHPGIVPLHDVGRDANGVLSIALRRIEGKSFAETLSEANGLDGRLALVPALVRACQAVAFAHEHGVVHRDLKPQNIMLGRFGETYVLDWGLALIEQREGSPIPPTSVSQKTAVVGTPAYMSPEQALGKPADARSDVWGLGACLYHLLAGQPPITGRSLKSAIGHAAAAEVSPVLAIEPLAPSDLAAICEKALSRERELRYPNATALAADLEAWLAGRTVSARNYSRAELLRRALKDNARGVAVLVTGVLLLGGVLAFDELRIRTERNEARTLVRDLMRDLPRQVQSAKPNVELINTLTARTQQWLGRTDLSADELEEACDALTLLGAANTDISAWAAARALYSRAIELSATGLAMQPRNARFMACEIEARGGLGYCESEVGDPARATQLFEEASRRADSWRGEQDASLRLAKAELSSKWGTFAWATDPALGGRLFVSSAEAALPLLDNPVARVRESALRRGTNAVMAIWSEGKLEEAVALSRRFYAAAAADCATQSLTAQRTCLYPLTSYASMAGWVDAPDAEQAIQQAMAVEAFVRSHDVDSVSELYDATILFLELGRYEEAMSRGRALRRTESASWGIELAPLAAVLAGDLEEFDAWAPLLTKTEAGGRLALGLREAAAGRYLDAARHLRAVQRENLWGRISWTAHPKPKLELPVVARPAFQRFLADFTGAYGAADMKRLSTAIDDFAAALEAL
jgi:hypothetical protein